MHYIVGAVIGLAIGVFMPSVARKIHAKLSEESKQGAQFADVVFKDIEKKL